MIVRPAPSNVSLYPFHGFFVGKARQRDAIAHNLEHSLAVLVNEVGEIDCIILCLRLIWLFPMALAVMSEWCSPHED